jgi:hypothetical protein
MTDHNRLDSAGAAAKGGSYESRTSDSAPSGGSRGPGRFGQEAATALEQSLGPSQGLGGVEEAAFLERWFGQQGRLIAQATWDSFELITNSTAEHEVRYRESDGRAVKRTWPGTFGLVPSFDGTLWVPIAATPSAYLSRMALQNEIFGDGIDLEGGMTSEEPSMIIGAPKGGLSLVISQPWIEAADAKKPHPEESEVCGYLGARGFAPLVSSFFGWQNTEENLVILDGKPDNFIKTAEGIMPIDLLITEHSVAA